MHISQVSIGQKTFNIAQASAVDQVRLVNLISSPLIQSKELYSAEDYTPSLLVAMLVGAPNELVKQVDSIVLYKAFEHGYDNVPVDVKTFQGSVMDYFELLAKAILVNAGDFFDWLSRKNQEEHVSPNQT